MPTNKRRKKTVNQKELNRRKTQAKIWHKMTHPNEEYENAERNRRRSTTIDEFSFDKISCLN